MRHEGTVQARLPGEAAGADAQRQTRQNRNRIQKQKRCGLLKLICVNLS